MADPVVLKLENRAYRWDGKRWCGLTDFTVPPLAVVARLNVLLAEASRAAEAERFARTVAEARTQQRPLRVLVTGSRTWADPGPIRRELALLPSGSVIIHGDARGADRLAGEAGAALGMKVTACPAEWKRYSKSAGLVRNRAMLEEHRPDVVLAFHPAIEQARGTRHMVELARKAGVPVRVVAG